MLIVHSFAVLFHPPGAGWDMAVLNLTVCCRFSACGYNDGSPIGHGCPCPFHSDRLTGARRLGEHQQTALLSLLHDLVLRTTPVRMQFQGFLTIGFFNPGQLEIFEKVPGNFQVFSKY